MEFSANVAHHLSHLLANPNTAPSWPISSLDLLARFVAHSATSPDPLRFSDLPRFNRTLERFAASHDKFAISLTRTHTSLSIISIKHRASELSNTGIKRRRKDDDDDSAEEEPEELDAHRATPPTIGITKFPKELQEAYAILQRPSAKMRLLAEKFNSNPAIFEPICPSVTKDQCLRSRSDERQSMNHICGRVHFRAIIRPHTDPTLGHCSYLNTCYSEPSYALSPSIPPAPTRFPGQPGQQGRFPQPDAGRAPASLPNGLGAGGRGKEKAPCRYLHFEVDWDVGENQYPSPSAKSIPRFGLGFGDGPNPLNSRTYPAQWINCDIRSFDYSVLGKFHVIMADPPWDIHMSLPYGTMTDDEMRAMPIPALQDEGLLFLWVTGRAMEVGRECLRVWGYRRVDEVVWVKTNQLQRIIRTGRTGHWINHTKEHMLVGLKSASNEAGEPIWPKWINRGLDTDVIVSEVRETSRKPDEAYGLIERMCPGGRKVEIFGRKHNARPGWLTLGNQLGADQIYEEELAERIRARYPERMQTGD